MFGPESGRQSWEGLTFQFEKVRIASHGQRTKFSAEERAEAFLDIWRSESSREGPHRQSRAAHQVLHGRHTSVSSPSDVMRGCNMVEMSCEEHDRLAASSQFITHTVGRVLGRLGPRPSRP
eukprot:1178485-Prorocentrum_minimum.AAC.2